MMLKKQTVWLLTMLSLVVVLSVYYVTSPEGGTSNIVMTGEDQEVSENATAEEATEEQPAEEEGTEGEKTEGKATEGEGAEAGEEADIQTEELEDGTVISSVSSDELFTDLRMQLDDQRNEMKEQLQAIVASNNASAEEKSDAYDEMEALNDAARKEMLLETLIKSKGFEDALVRAEGNDVKITIKAEEHSKTAANEIMLLVKDEMENMEDVIVTFQPVRDK
ncbi:MULTISPECIES: SpoIIIAH-like family protein [Bacillaceae]|uniref:SpoIIIAH-like family protein n=1 Tax=Bacillaceae TaxID=186817 RepID=UPI000BFBECD6|nr:MULTISPECIES: SpoIIIAH-like family protein [Bacillaceae]PGT87647.1 stage III sporulation protein AH [Bacillus sp. AFS040349]UGB29433.1 SpoIIIAH-like family protein [Metabacillus sp. B2-18]